MSDRRFHRGQGKIAAVLDVRLDELSRIQASYRLGGSYNLVDHRVSELGWCDFHARHSFRAVGKTPCAVLACQDCRNGMNAILERHWLSDEDNLQRRVRILEITGRDPILPDFSARIFPEQLSLDVFNDEPS